MWSVFIENMINEMQEHHKDYLIAITGFLKWSRINSGYTQSELSEMSGVHKNSISRYESQTSVNLTLYTIVKICEALDIKIEEVFKEL